MSALLKDPAAAAWFKSSYSSSGDGNDCVEVAIATATATVHIRDSKRPDGPRLAVTRAAWAGFLAGTGGN
ncbi:DUF397 domain-containing protein [Streptomyces sp. CL12-4]|uniref:DUF397 domain-containing protein n=1 Tax=Streptomyces sp. CL12-4 TaxID=2810306 RepID=UPI001EFADDE7|nr:DUF397 domain-containing protein [Streptomyces sp. CL12-4]MCG8968602.1 DUF397 domain-containing protein [Streptomyces sp. CL12-4]